MNLGNKSINFPVNAVLLQIFMHLWEILMREIA